jgi:multisubunit Na+/H+ antiporter MnhF subunit
MGMFLSFAVFALTIVYSMCLWNDTIYTDKVLALLIITYISYLIEQEYTKRNEN